MVRDSGAITVKSWDTSKDTVMSSPSPEGWPKTEGEVPVEQLLPNTKKTLVKKEQVYL